MNLQLSHNRYFFSIWNHARWVLFFCLSSSCSDSSDGNQPQGEYIYRLHNEFLFVPPPPEKNEPPTYEWSKNTVKGLPKITKEFFRCKGCSLNSDKVLERKGESIKISDCGGFDRHSLPLRDNQEFIYPVLIEILNHVQLKTEKRVVITSGHRCPEHNSYVDQSPSNLYSKHMLGAEVTFYVQDFEFQPEKIIPILMDYYKENPQFVGQPDFLDFKRYEKEDTNVSIPPWYNKEIYIKLFKQNEGRDFDNRHQYPYFSIQVRYDRDRQERVVYSWQQANQNYWRK